LSSKCAVCDNRGATYYYDRTDDMYHMSCWYEVYEAHAFGSGYDAAKEEYAESSCEDIDIALMLYDIDPPDSAFQWGHLRYLLEEKR